MLILADVDRAPFALFDAFADLRCRLALTGLLVGVEGFAEADAAFRGVFSGVTVEQAAVTLAAVAVAIAGLLIQHPLDAGGHRVGVLHENVVELCGVKRGGHRALGNFGVERRDLFLAFPLCRETFGVQRQA